MDNILKIINVNELSNLSFFVPAYQRGYRWTKLEVEDLLNDIDDFKAREIADSEDKTWYCLQPLVLKKHKVNNEYELIDGQQRLTTIYLILYYLNLDYVENKRDQLFNIIYETRSGSEHFLKNPEKKSDENIDYYYISQAYNTINNWFESRLVDPNFDKQNFRSKIKFYTKFIWYEIFDKNPIPVFSRLNIGKISLTNSELIKALFLNSSNYEKENKDVIKKRQFEIAAEWDNIEATLQNDKFWYFLSNENVDNNRIEFIFDLIAEQDYNNKDTYSTFRFFYNQMSAKNLATIDANWKKIKDYFQRFLEWFKKRELYHKIGFILYQNISHIKPLYEKSAELNKKDFSNYLNELIKKYFSDAKILDLQYGDKKTKPALLLYNLQTMLNNEHEQSYFPFDTFKLEKWDIEHIASLKDIDNSPNDVEQREQWIRDTSAYIDKDDTEGKKILLLIENINIQDKDKFKTLFSKITDYFNKNIINTQSDQIEEPNNLSNLTLLDSYTNRSYKNAVFPLKRKRIIERDKKGDFVPLCTKNTFLKYFSDYPPKASFWTTEDRQKYEEDLISILSNYMEAE